MQMSHLLILIGPAQRQQQKSAKHDDSVIIQRIDMIAIARALIVILFKDGL